MLLLGLLLLPMVLGASGELTIDNYVVNIENDTLKSVRTTGKSSVDLNLSGLGLRHVDKDAFSAPNNIKTLNLANNSLVELPQSVFAKLTDLEHLSLVDNRIKRFTNAFAGLDSLKTLNISNNPIGLLDTGGFYGLSRSVDIFTSGSSFEKISAHLFERGTESLREPTKEATRRRRSLIRIDFRRSQFRVKVCIDQGKLKLLENWATDKNLPSGCTTVPESNNGYYLENMNITSFESGWYRSKSDSIVKLSLRHNGIDRLTKEALNDLPKNIKYVSLDFNKIERLERGVIENFHIERLFMIGNRITKIEDFAFERTNIKDLIFSLNRLKNLEFVKTLPSDVRELTIEDNELTEIPDDSFSRVPELNYLRLDGNRITKIGRNSFRGISYLFHLGLSNNRITTVEPGCLRGFASLGDVSFRNNSMDKLENGTFDGPNDVLSIDLSRNKFTDVAKQIRDGLPKNLAILDLNYNEISSLEADSFANVPMRDLLLRGNKIKKIAKGSLQLRNLIRLDLGKNLLSYVDGETFVNHGQLRVLSLNDNAITKLEKGFAKHLHRLLQLNISRNPIKKLENGALHGLRNSDHDAYILTSGTPIEVIQGGLFDDV